MKILKSVRTIAGNRLTTRDPMKNEGTGTNTDHTHPNLPLLNSLTLDDNNILRTNNGPVQTHLIAEEW